MTQALYDALLALPSTSIATNFYLDDSDGDSVFDTTATERRHALRSHLRKVDAGDLVLIGEAAGWRGARQSGVPFTSAHHVGLTGTREASATVVQQALTNLRLPSRTLLWNTFPLHPHRPGEPRSNRRPTPGEQALTAALLDVAAAGRRVVCVGRIAADAYSAASGTVVPHVSEASRHSRAVAVRHPANGGAPEFRAALAAAARLWLL